MLNLWEWKSSLTIFIEFLKFIIPGAHSRIEPIPVTIIALSGTTLAGSASLVLKDMDTYPELTPWIASVYTIPEWRKQGIAARLIKRIIMESTKINIEKLYLFIENLQEYYKHFGWIKVKNCVYKNRSVTIMSKSMRRITVRVPLDP